MATKIYLDITQTYPRSNQAGYRDLLPTSSNSSATGPLGATVLPNGERQFRPASGSAPDSGFWSERVSVAATISGTITFQIRLFESLAVEARLRARLYRITAGGSMVESLVAQADSDVLTGGTPFNYVFTVVPTAFDVVPGERFILRLFAVATSEAIDSGAATIMYGIADRSWVEFTETLTFKTNGTPIVFRRTTASGIGSFRDLLETGGVTAFTKAHLPTITGATELQFRELSPNPLLTFTHLSVPGFASTTNASSYVSGSVTPVANKLYLLAVVTSDAAPEATVPTVSSTTGLTFVQVGSSIVFNTIADNLHRLTLFRALKTSGLSTGTFTVNLTDSGTGCAVIVHEVVDVDTTGVDGENAIRNVVTANSDNTANPSVTFGAVDEALVTKTYGCFGLSIATAPTVGANYTGFARTYSSPTTGLFAEYATGSQSVANCTVAASNWAAIGVEVVGPTFPLIEWVSSRVKGPGWFVDATVLDQIVTKLWGYCSHADANAAMRLKCWRRKPDGTELLVFSGDVAVEMLVNSAGSAQSLSSPTLAQETEFREDDRIIVRMYVTNLGGTMAGLHNCYFDYDDDGIDTDGNSYLRSLYDFEFKSEADPAGDEVVPSGGATLGMSNGQ